MNRSKTRFGLTASALALMLAAGPALADPATLWLAQGQPAQPQQTQQPAPPQTPPPVADGAAKAPHMPSTTTVPGVEMGKLPEAANANTPLTVPSAGAPASFADLVQNVSPAVVNITTTAVVSRPTGGIPGFPQGSPFSDLFRDFGIPGGPGEDGGFGGPMQQERSEALGSGFVVSADGVIVTNNHVIEGADEIEIEFYSGARLPAKVVGTDKTTDIAVLKVEAPKPLPFVKFGDSESSRVGDWVLALGNPLGQGFSASSGIISAKSRALTGTYDDFIQTDAAINRGNSGGPLFNMQGEVIGVNTAILSPNGGSIGIGFSMASNVVSKVVAQLQEFGETRRGWLGVKIQNVTPDIAESLGLPTQAGALVTDVPEGPALAAGIKSGDVITSFAGGEVKDTRDLVRRVADAPSGKAVSVTVLRGGQPVNLEVTLGRRELAEGTGDDAQSDGGQPGAGSEMLGLSLAPLSRDMADRLGLPADARGVVVQQVAPDSAAADKGLAPGDVIVEAGQKPVATPADLAAQVTAAREAGRKSLLLLIRRGGEPRFLALPLS